MYSQRTEQSKLDMYSLEIILEPLLLLGAFW